MDKDSLYYYLWSALNRVDCEVRSCASATERSYYAGLHMAYLDILGRLWPESAAQRLTDLAERDALKS